MPAIIFSGSQDGVTPPVDNHTPIYNGLASVCKSFVNIVGGGHCYFASTNFNCDFGETTSSTGISITRAEQQAKTYSVLDPWFDYILKGNNNSYSNYTSALNAMPGELISETTCQGLSIKENEIEYRFYPNPVNEKLVIENPNGNELTIELMNLLGELILKTKTSSLVDLSGLKTGFYTVRINGVNYTIIKD